MALRASVLLTLCLVFAGHALALPAPASGGASHVPRAEAHAPIRIVSDLALLVPDAVSGNGVVRGSGTASDPFVIEGWEIRFDGSTPAVTIRQTRMHLVLRDLVLLPSKPPQPTDFAVGPALDVADVSNLTLERVRVEDDWDGSTFAASRVTLRDVTLANATLLARGGTLDVQGLTSRGATRELGTLACIGCRLDARDVRIWGEPATLRQAGIQPHDQGGLSLVEGAQARIEDLEALNMGRAGVVYVADSSLDWRGGRAEDGASVVSAHRSSVRLSGIRHEAAHASSTFAVLFESEADVADVEVRTATGALVAGGEALFDRVTFDGSDVGLVASDAPGPGGKPPRVIVRNSSFVDTREYGVRADTPAPVDARWNWWGSGQGPVAGRSSDGRAGVSGAGVSVDPWLREGPPSEEGPRPMPTLPGASLLAVLALGALARRGHVPR